MQLNDGASKFIKFVIKYRPLLPPGITVFLSISLFLAICFKIDGLGIFSIVAGLIFFFFIMYAASKESGPSGGGDDYSFEKNIVENLHKIFEPKYLNLIFIFFLRAVPYLIQNSSKLKTDEAEQLKDATSRLLQKLSRTPSPEDPAPSPEPERKKARP